MIPKTFSASSMQVATSCPARYKAEYIDRTPDFSNNAALVGTAVHGALEEFVKALKFDKTVEWQFSILEAYYMLSFEKTFGTSRRDSDEYLDGLDLLMKWFERNTDSFAQVNVISCEVKSTFNLQTSIGPIPFTYIWDRADRIGDKSLKVVDYKTIRKFVRPEELRQKIQPRAYGLAAQMQYPDAEEIWVEYDLLRYHPVSAVFTKDDNRAFYYYLVDEAERIIALDPDAVDEKGKPIPIPEVLNEECNYCVRKSICETLLKHNAGGGILGLSPEQIVQKRLEVASQLKALRVLDEQLDAALCKEAESEDKFEWSVGKYDVSITARKSRKISSVSAVANIVGPDMLKRYGNVTLANLDKLLKNEELTDFQRDQLKSLIEVEWSEPRSVVKEKKF